MADRMPMVQTALTLGLLSALLHALWGAVVAAGLGPAVVQYWQSVHFKSYPVTVLSFDLASWVMGTVGAFVAGYLVGALFAWLWNAMAPRGRAAAAPKGRRRR